MICQKKLQTRTQFFHRRLFSSFHNSLSLPPPSRTPPSLPPSIPPSLSLSCSLSLFQSFSFSIPFGTGLNSPSNSAASVLIGKENSPENVHAQAELSISRKAFNDEQVRKCQRPQPDIT